MKFGIFILTHGRAKTISTYKVLRDSGFTGDIWVVIDNEDNDEPEYRKKFGKRIIQFDKRDYIKKTDLGDLDTDRRIGVFARNFIQDKAKEMGYDIHLQLDDDIHGFYYRYVVGKRLLAKKIVRLDKVFQAICDYIMETGITGISLGAGSYTLGGINLNWKKQMIPKCMTTFFLRSDDVNYFNMRMNDDITTSALNWTRGKQYFTIMPIQATVSETQQVSGGMTEAYLETGTYRKTFYSVMALPSCSKVATMGITNKRIHHHIQWVNCTPKILSDKFRRQ